MHVFQIKKGGLEKFRDITQVCLIPRPMFFFFCFLFFNKFIYLFLAVLGLCCYARAFSSCGERGLLFVALRRLLIAVASLAVEHGL